MTCTLSVNSGHVRLDGVKLGARSPAQLVLSGEGARGAWRVIEAFGDQPFDLQLRWSAGSGAGAKATVSVARSARVCVFAHSVRALAVNRSPDPNRVQVLASDGETPTTNVWSVVEGPGEVAYTLPIASFARSVRVELGLPQPSASSRPSGHRSSRRGGPSLPTTPSAPLLALVDGYGRVLSLTRLDQQPPTGVPVGAAASLRIFAGSSDVLVRALFHLAL